MEKAILKKFAIESRQELMKKIENKIKLFYIDETFNMQQNGDIYVLSNESHTLSLSNEEHKKRELLINRVNELGLEQVIEESAYTWFNRLIAIRYMEINDYLPLTKDNQSLGIRVLSSKENTPDPEIMKFTNLTNPDLDIDFKKEKYIEIKEDNKRFEYILLLICKKLGKVIPQVFDGITDYIDILIPDNLLNDSGYITKLITEVPEENYNQVEIIGWLYQYYNQIEKDRVISAKKTYKKNEIAYATQLFTPDWIVKYMVENSLGKYWIEHNGNKDLIKKWKYFVTDDQVRLKENVDPKNIKCIDPCMGSGHILVYMFEVLYQIYESYGYSKNDIAKLILENNLYGLDIDDRAGQLSILSVLLKAREYDKQIFNKNISQTLNIMSLQESHIDDIVKFVSVSDKIKNTLKHLNDIYIDSKEIGSLLVVDKTDYKDVIDFAYNDDSIFGIEMLKKIMPMIKQDEIMCNKYDIVITNPPYMNNNVMSSKLKDYIVSNYKVSKSDLFSSFIVRNHKFCKKNGYLAFMTPYVWMFITSYESLRKYIIDNLNISSLIQLEYSALEEAVVPLCTFILNNSSENIDGYFFRLSDFTGGMEVQNKMFLDIKEKNNNKYIFKKNTKDFLNISGYPIAYWENQSIYDLFKKNEMLVNYALPKQGLATGNNDYFLKLWFEVNNNNIGFNMKNRELAQQSHKKWFPCNKGGAFRKWYGNNDYIVNWENDGYEIRNYKDENGKLRSRPQNIDYYFKSGMTWSTISSAKLSMRFSPQGNLFETKGSICFVKEEKNFYYILGFFNSLVVEKLLKILSPTLDFHEGPLGKLPMIIKEDMEINDLVKENIILAKEDWDSFEISYDFKKHPLIQQITYFIDNKEHMLKDIFNLWEKSCNEKFGLLKNNEERLNKKFIEIYGLIDELDYKVEDKDITMRKAEKVRDIKSLISYAVGCMFGRYSLDKEGLIYAGGEFDESQYKTFKVDLDNIIPISDESYFADDIVARFKKFVEVVYGKETLSANLDFIAETLGKKGTETSEETIRRYFLNDFYADHIKMYQKKPIYWLFDSGKKNGFKALIYMHRYNENTVPKVRLDYLHKIQMIYERQLSDVNDKLKMELTLSDKKETQKKQAELGAKLQELIDYDEKIAHIANQRISIDLDDGVTANYSKFSDILAKIK